MEITEGMLTDMNEQCRWEEAEDGGSDKKKKKKGFIRSNLSAKQADQSTRNKYTHSTYI